MLTSHLLLGLHPEGFTPEKSRTNGLQDELLGVPCLRLRLCWPPTDGAWQSEELGKVPPMVIICVPLTTSQESEGCPYDGTTVLGTILSIRAQEELEYRRRQMPWIR